MNALEPRHLKTVERWTLILAAIVVAVGFAFLPRPVATAASVGAGLMIVNAWAIRKLAERLFKKAEGPGPGIAVLLFNVKMFALIALVYVAVKVLGLDAIGFLVGVSVFPVAIVAAALHLNLGSDDSDEASSPPISPLHPPTGDR
jgi:hypothetical protein